MKRPKCMSGIFKDIQSNRKAVQKESQQFGVFSFKKDDSLYKQPSKTVSTMEEAKRWAKKLEELNPGKKFTAKTIS